MGRKEIFALVLVSKFFAKFVGIRFTESRDSVDKCLPMPYTNGVHTSTKSGGFIW